MSDPKPNGTQRLLDKLKKCITSGSYYEALQTYKCVYFRYLRTEQYNELLELLHHGAVLFLEHNQHANGVELATLLIESLGRSRNKNYADWTPKLCEIFALMPDSSPDREKFITGAIQWTCGEGGTTGNAGHCGMHQKVAEIYWKEKNYGRARHHYIFSKDGTGCGTLLVEFQMIQAFKSEIDLFIAQVVLQCLCYKDKGTANQSFLIYTTKHPSIGNSQPPYCWPLLNFLFLLLRAVESPKLQTFTILCEQYKPSIERDPYYFVYLDKIGQNFFGVKPPRKQQSRGLFGNLLDSIMGSLSDETSPDGGGESSYNGTRTGYSSNVLDLE